MNFIKEYLRFNSAALRLYAHFQNLFYAHNVTDKVMERTNLPILDYIQCSQPLPMSFYDAYPENNLYGTSRILKVYSREALRHFTHTYIEHGLFFGDYVARHSVGYTDVKRIITFSNYRKQILGDNEAVKKAGIQIAVIGPYINYAKPLLAPEKIGDIKGRFGKILLVFPSHSIPNETVSFDSRSLVNEIIRVKELMKLDTVFVCLYWKDIEDRLLANEYKERGFHVVCAGHRYDPYFLNRLRSIIELSDYTMSNDVGTNLGYCIGLGKPHYVFSQEISFKEGLQNIMKSENQSEQVFTSAIAARDHVANFFKAPVEEITDEQRKIVDFYWGINELRTPEEILRIYQ